MTKINTYSSSLSRTVAYIFIIIIGFNAVSYGMFMDGLWYANIAKNLANNKGSFWDLYFTETLFTHFREHPPLQMILHSFLYKIFGDAIWVDKIFGIICYAFIAYFLKKCWHLLVEENYKKLVWLPFLFFISIPLVTWAATNNMLENTMSVFTIATLFWILQFYKTHKKIYFVLAAFALVLAFLSKGFVSLFVLTIPFFYHLIVTKKFKKSIIDSSILLLLSVAIISILFLFLPNSYKFISEYFTKQIVFSLKNVANVNSRFYIVGKLITELLPAIILCLLFYFFNRNKTKSSSQNQPSLFLFIVGLCGVLPIMISLKQSGFYILATFPFFSLAFAFLIKDYVLPFQNFVEKKAAQLYKINDALMAVCLFIIVFNAKKINRDKEMIEDVFEIKKIVAKNSIININNNLFNNWQLHGYLHRYNDISIDTSEKEHLYYLIQKNDSLKFIDYRKVKDLQNFTLYSKK